MPSLAEFRAARRTTMTLPASGLDVTLKRVTAIDLAARGAIPTPLHGQVQALVAQAEGGSPLRLDLTTFPEYAAVIDLVASAALIDPAVAEVADETHLTIDELPFADRVFIFQWAQGGADALATFPGDAAGPGAGAGPGGGEVRAPAKRAAAARLA